MAGFSCDYCVNFEYDEELEEYTCIVSMDEDDLARMSMREYKECPYFRNGDEYLIVRKQI